MKWITNQHLVIISGIIFGVMAGLAIMENLP